MLFHFILTFQLVDLNILNSLSDSDRWILHTRCSNFAMIRLPPFSALPSASSRRVWRSFTCCSRPLRSRSTWTACSCSRRNSSAKRAVSASRRSKETSAVRERKRLTSFLRTFLDVLQFGHGFIQIGLHGGDVRFQLSALGGESGILRAQLADTISCFVQFTFGCLACAFSLFESGSQLFQFANDQIGTTFSGSSDFSCFVALSLFAFDLHLKFSDRLLNAFDGLLQIDIRTVRMVQRRFEFVDIWFEFLLLKTTSRAMKRNRSVGRSVTCFRASAFARVSASRLACIDSMARAWLRRVTSNSSSFSWMRRSISWRMVLSSICERRTFASSCSNADSASSKASWISSFSNSARLRAFSISCKLKKTNPFFTLNACLSGSTDPLPPSLNWSVSSWTRKSLKHCWRKRMSRLL